MADCERILHVLHSMNCGGAENLIMNIYRNIDREKIQFDFLVNFYGEMYFQKEIELLGGRIYRMKTLLRLTPPVYKARLIKFFRKHTDYKVVHSHLETTTGIILACAKSAGVPARIAHAHNTGFTRSGGLYQLENLYKDYCRKKIIPNSTANIACSEPAAQWLFTNQYISAAIIRNGIDTEKFRFDPSVRQQIANELDIVETTTVLVHTGRFYDQKNHIFLLDAFEAYFKVNPCSLLLLIGEGPLQKQIEAKAAEKGLSDVVRFLGLRKDVSRLLQRADVFLMPSKFEGLPLALVEAQCAGLNCYVSDHVPPEADLGCGLVTFLTIDSPGVWAINIKNSPVKRENASNKVAAAGYSVKETAKHLEDLYVKMLYKAQ